MLTGLPILLIAVAGISLGFWTISGYSSAPPPNKTGSPGDAGQSCKNCHQYGSFQISGLITSNMPNGRFTPGQTYTITINATFPGHTKFGFEISPQDINGNLIGSLSITDPSRTQILSNNRDIGHTLSGTLGSNGFISWSFNWTAPSSPLDSVNFYLALNVTNNNGSTTGDSIYLEVKTFYRDVSSSIVELWQEDNNIATDPILILYDITGRLFALPPKSQTYPQGKCMSNIVFIREQGRWKAYLK